jgi:hypothetical protein
MTREEIRHHALQIAALRAHQNRSAGQRRRNDRGFDTLQDFRKDKTHGANLRRSDHGFAAVDRVFEANLRFGLLPKGSWL